MIMLHTSSDRGHANSGLRLAAGKAAKLDGEAQLELRHGHGAEMLVFDLAR